jgi:hypothetical protein
MDLALGYLSVYVPLVFVWLGLGLLLILGVSLLFRLWNKLLDKLLPPKDKE